MTITDWLLVVIAVELGIAISVLKAIADGLWQLKEFFRTRKWSTPD